MTIHVVFFGTIIDFSILFLKILLFFYVHVCVPCEFMCKSAERQEKSIRSLGTGVMGTCELPDVGLGTESTSFCKNRKDSRLLSHLQDQF